MYLIGNSDYTGATSRVLTFSPGERTITTTVLTIGDQILENDETFNAILQNELPGPRVQIGVDEAQGIILNDDSECVVCIYRVLSTGMGGARCPAPSSHSMILRMWPTNSSSVPLPSISGFAPDWGGGVEVLTPTSHRVC